MSQADQVIQNGTFPAVRADLNNNFAALFTDNSGPSAPSPTVTFMDWIDTSTVTPVWRKRNAANNAWVTVGQITGTDLNVASATTATTATSATSATNATNATNLTGTSTGNIQSAALGSGTASNTTFLRGDRTWQTVNTSVTTQQVLDATAGASVGAVGTYAWIIKTFISGNTTYASPGDTKAASDLRYAGHWGETGASATMGGSFATTPVPSGTWRCMGFARNSGGTTLNAYTLWLRIS
jgi:hypothetical protein